MPILPIVYVIVEHDIGLKEFTILGVATSEEKTIDLLKEYYHDYEEITSRDIRDSGLLWEKTLLVEGLNNIKEKVIVTAQWFNPDTL